MSNIINIGGGGKKAKSQAYITNNNETIILPDIQDGTQANITTMLSLRFVIYNAGNIKSFRHPTSQSVHLYDENGNDIGKTSTKPVDMSGVTYATGWDNGNYTGTFTFTCE